MIVCVPAQMEEAFSDHKTSIDIMALQLKRLLKYDVL